MPKNIEIELKFRLLNVDEVQKFLTAHAKFDYEAFQHDVYYNAPHRDFLANKANISEWLRIRVQADKAQINYKDWQPRENPIKTHCKEYETDVASYEQLERILDALDFKKLIEVKKHRRAWSYQDVEVSIDSVEELGDCLEVEYKGSKLADVNEARDYLHQIVKKLGAKTKGLDLNGYPYGLLAKKKLI
ncbi:MAG TPA: class IV adenylate cyclase [Candidatus Saccharimonadales bacterium]|nr:class IV adenylate cyclase [Candidatus Saccharimonadales bacterium]